MSTQYQADEITSELHKLCAQQDVRCLLAVESGSRAWGFASQDSDYDVRFIYLRPEADYLLIDRPRDVIEYMSPDGLDMVGWDAAKALPLLAKSNPSIIEWLDTPIVYHKEPSAFAILRQAAKQCFSPKALALHYISLGEDHIKKYVHGQTTIMPKRYFYTLRAVLSAEFVLAHHSPAPIVFDDLLGQSKISTSLKSIIDELLAVKKQGAEKEHVPQIEPLNNFVVTKLETLRQRVKTLPSTNPHAKQVTEETFKQLLAWQKTLRAA